MILTGKQIEALAILGERHPGTATLTDIGSGVQVLIGSTGRYKIDGAGAIRTFDPVRGRWATQADDDQRAADEGDEHRDYAEERFNDSLMREV